MYDYGMVKSFHDQRMRQFMIEAERAHLIRQLRQRRGSERSWSDRFAAMGRKWQRALRSRPQPAS